MKLRLSHDKLDLECFNISKGWSNYKVYANRIKKSLYYGRFPSTDRPSLPVTELLVDKFGQFCKQDGLDQLELHGASSICFDACVTPCSVIVALLYLDRLRTHNPEYLASTSPSQVFVVAMMVASKYLYDDGEEDEVFNDEWAASAAMLLMDLNQAERSFLAAIDWNLFVDIKLFLEGLVYVESEVAIKESVARGFFVYSDLVALSNILPPIWNSLLNIVGSALLVCVVGYTACLCVVTAGTLMTKECSFHIADHLRYTLLAPPTQQHLTDECEGPTNSSSIADCIEHFEASIVNESCRMESFTEMREEPAPEYDGNTLQSSPSNGRFNALRTLTTALLLASSTAAKFTEVTSSLSMLAQSHLSPSGTIHNATMECCSVPFQPRYFTDHNRECDCLHGLNLTMYDQVNLGNSNGMHLQRHLKKKTLIRHSRTKKMGRRASEVLLNDMGAVKIPVLRTTGIYHEVTFKETNQDLLNHENGALNLAVDFSYSSSVIYPGEDLHDRLSFLSLNVDYDLHQEEQDILGYADIENQTNFFRFRPVSYKSHLQTETFPYLMQEKMPPDISHYLPFWIWKPFPFDQTEQLIRVN